MLAEDDESETEDEEHTISIVETGSQKGKKKLVCSNGFSYCVRVSNLIK